jgi:DNA repair photolyase
MDLWYNQNRAPEFELKESKMILHPFTVKDYKGLTINPYQGCQHRCGYCYATYEWSPEFYDRVYAKSNSPQILEKQLRLWKFKKQIHPVMISSATDAYQAAELKFELTRKCVEVLQNHNFPYYVFTKSTIIKRDLELHKRYKDNCIIVWSITTSDENIRRCIEPGTPPAAAMFEVISKFTDLGIRCCINIDPILPLITDSSDNIESIISSSQKANVKYISGAILRLRRDIWERMKIILKLLDIKNGIKEYNRIFQFTEPINPDRNIAASYSYTNSILGKIRKSVLKRNMNFEFPKLDATSNMERRWISNNTNQLTLVDYM